MKKIEGVLNAWKAKAFTKRTMRAGNIKAPYSRFG